MRITPAVVACVSALAVAVALVGCAASSPPERTTPNRAEQQAVDRAVIDSGVSELAGSGAWVQLWTPEAAGPAVTECASRALHGSARISGGFDITGGFGWTATFGNSSTDISATEMEALQVSVARCQVSHPVDTRVSRVAASKRSALYSYDVTVLRRCLLSHGQSVGEAPSRRSFLGLLRGGLASWSPYDRVVVSTRAQWYALSDACPVLPPGMAD